MANGLLYPRTPTTQYFVPGVPPHCPVPYRTPRFSKAKSTDFFWSQLVTNDDNDDNDDDDDNDDNDGRCLCLTYAQYSYVVFEWCPQYILCSSNKDSRDVTVSTHKQRLLSLHILCDSCLLWWHHLVSSAFSRAACKVSMSSRSEKPILLELL